MKQIKWRPAVKPLDVAQEDLVSVAQLSNFGNIVWTPAGNLYLIADGNWYRAEVEVA